MEVCNLIIVLMTIVKGMNAGSYQSYVDDDLVGSGKISQAAILRFDGSSLAESRDVNLQPGEGNAILELFKNPSSVFDTGVTVGGVNFMGVQGQRRSIYANKGPTGVVIVKTRQSIIIGVYDKYQQFGNAINVVEGLKDSFIENGE